MCGIASLLVAASVSNFSFYSPFFSLIAAAEGVPSTVLLGSFAAGQSHTRLASAVDWLIAL